MLRKGKKKHGLPELSRQEATKGIIAFSCIVQVCELIGIDCTELIAELKGILEQYPDLWILVDDETELLINAA